MSEELIDKYFAGELSPEERTSLERKLKEDNDFAKAFQLEKDLMEGLETMGNKNLRPKLEKIYQEEVMEEKKEVKTSTPVHQISTKSNRRWWLAAASIAIIALLTWMFWPQVSPQKLYAAHAQHEFDFTEKGSPDQVLYQAETALKANDFAAALPLLENYLSSRPDAYNIVLAKGIAHLELDDHEKAILTFRQLTRVNSLYKTEGTWYLALANLKGGQVESCRQLLRELPPDSGRYQQAQNLLEQLKKLE